MAFRTFFFENINIIIVDMLCIMCSVDVLIPFFRSLENMFMTTCASVFMSLVMHVSSSTTLITCAHSSAQALIAHRQSPLRVARFFLASLPQLLSSSSLAFILGCGFQGCRPDAVQRPKMSPLSPPRGLATTRRCMMTCNGSEPPVRSHMSLKRRLAVSMPAHLHRLRLRTHMDCHLQRFAIKSVRDLQSVVVRAQTLVQLRQACLRHQSFRMRAALWRRPQPPQVHLVLQSRVQRPLQVAGRRQPRRPQ